MELNDLPDLCLLVLFELFPVSVQAQHRRVCQRWKTLMQHVWNKVLKVNLGFCGASKITFGERRAEFNTGLNHHRFITSANFPHLCSLQFMSLDTSDPHHSQVCEYLTELAGQLTHLDLYLKHDKSPDRLEGPSVQSKVWNLIGTMHSLQSLCLCFSEKENSPKRRIWRIPQNLSILGNLRNFELTNDTEYEMAGLTQLGSNLESLKLRCSAVNSRLTLSNAPKLVSLRSLSIDVVSELSFWQVLTTLTTLPQLESLTFITIDWPQLVQALSTSSLQPNYPRFGSVKHLAILVLFSLHASVYSQAPKLTETELDKFKLDFFYRIPIMFPSLESIQVGLGEEYNQQDFNRLFNEQLNQMLDSMRRRRLRRQT